MNLLILGLVLVGVVAVAALILHFTKNKWFAGVFAKAEADMAEVKAEIAKLKADVETLFSKKK